MDCEDLVRYLSDYIDQNLNSELDAEARAHLRTCHNCRVVLDSTQQTILLYREHGQHRAMPTERRQNLFDKLASALNPRTDLDSPSQR